MAEIGVAEGDFSKEILSTTAPDVLHLIDSWEHHDRADYANDPNNVSDMRQQGRFESVVARFEEESRQGKVRINRAYSHDAADAFDTEQLDWIYVDAMHTTHAVYRDLVAFHDTVKREGFIVGHDYTNHVQARSWNFGVIEAVNRFVAEFGYGFLALTLEAFPTYLLAKDPGSIAATKLVERLITEVPYIVEIRGFPAARPFEHKSVKRGDQIRVYPSF